ncbi:MAG: UvrD-helicase domain-containing protein, partial [Bacillota bacterium]|nr:UvrD-helicase domain-containing protein [Bacillota bacterium]
MKLTRQQQLAVDLEGFNILVAAGAGSGKTRVLVERVVRQLEAGLASIDNYLILTFTNAAAAELKERIQLALEQSSNPDVRRQIGRLSVASIKTFHAFCADICRNYAHASDLDSGFRILVDHEANILLRRAVESAMEQSFARRDENFLRLISAFSKENSNERVMEMALKLYRYSYSFVDPHATLEAAADAYTNGDAEKWKRDGFDELRRQFRAIDFTELEAAVAELPEKPMARYRDYIDRYRDYVNTLESLPLDADESASDAPRAPSVRKDEIGAELAEELKNLREEIVEQVKAAITFRAQLRNADEDIELSAPLMRALVDLTHQIAAEYRRAKRRMNFADYNDLEQYAIRILADDGIAGEVRASYRYLYVDEYQDSSAIQEHILDRIARADNRFMVGDIKQSIYKFRNAEPSIFARKLSRFLRIDAMEEAAALAEPNATIVLGDNFRTRREILETINQVFERHMHGEVEFDETAKLNAGAAYESEESSYVEYLRVSKDKEEVAVADRIASLIGTPIYDARAGIFRPCRYRDIVVLHRSPRSVMKDFELEFDRRDIPFYAEPIDGFFQSLEIRLIHALLSIVDNPLRDTEWIAVMRAFFGIDLPTIAHIASLEGSSFFARCKQFLRETENARVERMMQTVEQLQGRVHFMPLDDLIWDLYRVGDFYARMGKLPRGKQRQANLKQLVDIATSVRSSEVVSLSSFLQIVADVKDSGSDYGTAKTLSEADDVVRFMSVHKSKGLEFPIVILAGAARGFQLRDAQGDLILNKNYAIAIAPVETTLRAKHPFFLSTLVGQKNVYEVEQEELRLLYVAMTRAMERLILIGGENDRNGYARWLKELSAPAASTSDE